MTWTHVVAMHWAALSAGRKVWIDVSDVAPISSEGYRVRGWPVGQSCDYAISFTDGSRLHVQCFGDRYRLHLDSLDPTRYPVAHAVFETPIGLALLGGLVALAVLAFTQR